MTLKKSNISDLFQHLFWDVDAQMLDFENNKKLIIQKVLQYGLIEDWSIIQKIYGIVEIANVAIQIKDLDDRSQAFISCISNFPNEKFLCYTTKQSTPKHWNFFKNFNV